MKLIQSSHVVTFHSGQKWGEQMSRTPPARPATSTLRADSSDFGPEGFCCWTKLHDWRESIEKSTVRKEWKSANQEVFTTEDDPETEECWVEDTLLNILKQQHPCPLKAQREKLHRHVQERHGDPQSEDHPVQDKNTHCNGFRCS